MQPNTIGIREIVDKLKYKLSYDYKLKEYLKTITPEYNLIKSSIAEEIYYNAKKQNKELDYILEQDALVDRKIADRYKLFFNYCNSNESLMKTNLIKRYPIFGLEPIDNFTHLYDEIDESLLNTSLFTINEKYKNEVEKLKFPSVTNILRLSENQAQREVLIKWKLKKVEELGCKGYERYLEKLKARGIEFHHGIEQFAAGKDYDSIILNEVCEGAWKSVKTLLNIDLKEFLLSEAPVTHKNLCYYGRLDSICKYKDDLYIIDWKLSEKQKDNINSLYDNPLQLVAYLGAFLADHTYQSFRCDHKINKIMVIHTYIDGRPPSIHTFTYQQIIYYWIMFLTRLQTFWQNVSIISNGKSLF